MKKKKTILLFVLVLIIIVVSLSTGFFVIQPIGAIPNGGTIWFVRIGLNVPFISSADGLLLKNEIEVSILSRIMMLTSIVEIIKNRKIISLPYIDTFYVISTGGIRFEK